MAKQKAMQKAVARKDISYWEYTRREMKRNCFLHCFLFCHFFSLLYLSVEGVR